jgi:hypothetical protein
MLDKAITILNVEERHKFNRFGGAEKMMVYFFTAGAFGPFSEEFKAAEDHTEAVHRRLNERAQKLRDTGALKD